MEHKFHKCTEENCYICNGVLSFCTVCGGAEDGLTTHCLGRRISESEEKDVYLKIRDFKNNKWILI